MFTELSGALGKRTKYQQQDYAQLLLIAKSSLIKSETVSTESVNTAQNPIKPVRFMKEKPKDIDESEAESKDAWKHAEWELGRRLVGEVGESGDEAAVREVMLDSMDGGPEENILLEGGPKFTEQRDKGSELHSLDQAIILALCLDVSNSNPSVSNSYFTVCTFNLLSIWICYYWITS